MLQYIRRYLEFLSQIGLCLLFLTKAACTGEGEEIVENMEKISTGIEENVETQKIKRKEMESSKVLAKINRKAVGSGTFRSLFSEMLDLELNYKEMIILFEKIQFTPTHYAFLKCTGYDITAIISQVKHYEGSPSSAEEWVKSLNIKMLKTNFQYLKKNAWDDYTTFADLANIHTSKNNYPEVILEREMIPEQTSVNKTPFEERKKEVQQWFHQTNKNTTWKNTLPYVVGVGVLSIGVFLFIHEKKQGL